MADAYNRRAWHIPEMTIFQKRGIFVRFYAVIITVFAVFLIVLPLLWQTPAPPVVQEEETAPQKENTEEVKTDEAAQWVQPLLPEETPSPAAALPTVEEPLDTGFRILDESTGVIHEISVQDYVRGAVCSEMPSTFHTEALKAQAVSAHTYALNLKKQQAQNPNPSLQGADFKADPSNWRGYVTEEQARERFGSQFDQHWEKICTAVDAVYNQLLLYEDEPIAAAYHAISNGTTEGSENVWGRHLPYLQPVRSDGDLLAPGYEKQQIYTAEEMQKTILSAFPQAVLGEDPGEWLIITQRSPSGYVTAMEIGGVPVTGLEFRSALGLRSSDFTAEQNGGVFTVTTAGYGHGVGLSQYGADYMARQGSSYQEILAHYYQGSQLVQVANQ